MAEWNGEERRRYTDLLIELKTDMTHVKGYLEKLENKLIYMNGVKTDVRWLKWLVRGAWTALAALTGWEHFKD